MITAPSSAKPFHLGDILTITTDTMLALDGMDAIYRLLRHMAGESVFTHQLLRVADECVPHLHAQHPDLADVAVPDWSGGVDRAVVEAWLAEQVERFGETREVVPLPPGAHTFGVDPVAELEMLKPGGVIVVRDGEPGV